MKKYIFGAVFSLALLASPAFTQAATLTYAQINAIVSLLQSFGADQTTINNVQNSLNGGTTTGGGGTKQWCYTFKNDLTIGITENDDLLALSHAMALSGIDGGGIQIFNEDVAAAVVKFQAKYGIRQTGYVGPITRAKLNALYGCPPPQQSITVLSPNGGENFEVGNTYAITWSGFSSSNRVDIVLVKEHQDYPGLFDFVKKPDGTMYYPAENYENKFTYQWTAPEFLKEGKYKVGISDLRVGIMPQINGGWDYSDAPFSIVTDVVPINLPDLIVESIDINPNPAIVGQQTSLTARIRNVGTVSTTNVISSFFSVDWGAYVPATNMTQDSGHTCTGAPLAPQATCLIALSTRFISPASANTVTVKVDYGNGVYESNEVNNARTVIFSIVTDTPVSTPVTLSSITPSSGPVGTSIRLDGCGSDSSSGFTLVYSGPKSGTASIPVETLGAASGCGYMTFSVPTDFPAGTYTLSVKNNQTGAMSTNSKVFTVTAPNPTPTLTVTPSNASVQVGGTQQFIAMYDPDGTGPLSPVDVTVSASWFASPSATVSKGLATGQSAGDAFINAIYSGIAKSVSIHVTASLVPNNPVASVSPTSFVAGASFTSSITGATPNTQIRIFSTGPDGVTSEDMPAGTTNSSGAFSRTHNTTGWAAGTYRGWVTVNGVQSNVATFTVTAPIQTITISRTPGTSLASPFKVGDATVSSSVNTPSLFASNLTGTGYNQIGTNAPRTFTFTTFDLVNSGACNATTGICNMPGNWDAASFVCPAGLGVGTTQYMTEWYTIGNVTSNKLNWFFKCSGTVTSMGAYTNPGLASALGAFGGATNSTSQSTSGFSYTWTRDLQIGSLYPDDIAALQQALTREGVYAGEITGGFYNQTYAAVKAFQEKYGINQTGYVGQLTRAQLNTLFAR